MDTYYIKLEDSVYQVRVNNGVREVKLNGSWISHGDFVDHLADLGKWGEVAELCRAAFVLRPDEARQIILANT